MGKKKQPGRFTLQFNMEDPQQKTVSELLEQQGRHKAQFITSAILRYIQSPMPRETGGGLPAVDKDMMQQMLLSIMKRYPQDAPVSPGKPAHTEKPSAQLFPNAKGWDSPIGDDAMTAISETLAAFQQG